MHLLNRLILVGDVQSIPMTRVFIASFLYSALSQKKVEKTSDLPFVTSSRVQSIFCKGLFDRCLNKALEICCIDPSPSEGSIKVCVEDIFLNDKAYIFVFHPSIPTNFSNR